MRVHPVDPARDLDRLREFLSTSDPSDYLLDDLDGWIGDGRLWAGEVDGRWVAFGRLHDLGRAEGWLSGLRVARAERGHGLGADLLRALIADARSLGLRELRATIEDGNRASRRLFERQGFGSVVEMTLRCGSAGASDARTLRRLGPDDSFAEGVGWIPAATGRSDVLPGSDGGRFGVWDPRLLERWAREGKLFVGPGVAVAVQVDWLVAPRTLWVNPLRGEPSVLFPAVGALAKRLGQEVWQAFLPTSDRAREEYARLGLRPHPHWGDRVHLYERVEPREALSPVRGRRRGAVQA